MDLQIANTVTEKKEFICKSNLPKKKKATLELYSYPQSKFSYKSQRNKKQGC